MMPKNYDNEIIIKAYNIRAAAHGLVGILRRSDWHGERIAPARGL